MKEFSIPTEFQRFPKQWKTMPFFEVISDETGGNPKVLTSDYLASGTLPVIDQGNSAIAGYVNEVSLKCKAKLPCILFGDHTKIFKFVDHPFTLGADGVKVLVPTADLDPKFAYHYLKQVRLPDNAGYSRHFKFLKETYIPLPPLPEQKLIATILDKADSIRCKRQEAARMTEDLLRSVFLDCFGDPVRNPKGWKTGVLGDVIFSAKDGPHVSPEYSTDGIPFLSARHVKPGRIEWNDLKHVTIEEAKIHWKKCKPEMGDILYTKGGTTGVAAVFDSDKEIAVWVHIALLKLKHNKVNPYWLENMLNSKYCYNQSQRYTHGITNQDLGLKRMVNIEMYIPPLSEQNKFHSAVKIIKNIASMNASYFQESEKAFNSLLQSAFKGELIRNAGIAQ